MLIKPSKVSLFDHRAEPGWNKSFYLDFGLFETIKVAPMAPVFKNTTCRFDSAALT